MSRKLIWNHAIFFLSEIGEKIGKKFASSRYTLSSLAVLLFCTPLEQTDLTRIKHRQVLGSSIDAPLSQPRRRIPVEK